MRRALAGIGLGVVMLAAGCAGPRYVDGMFQSDKGYRVAVPGADWIVVSRTRADLEIRHRAEPAGMLVKASCGQVSQRAPLDVLARHLLTGLRDRSVVSAEEIALNGKVAHHAVLDGRVSEDLAAPGERDAAVRVEVYVMRDDRCIYDLLYVAPPESFDDWRPAFERLVESFHTQ